jgi:2-polyprenyl-3-methyl-5-hydroxy-6-metoxy-1,4-benzoquinol methylase
MRVSQDGVAADQAAYSRWTLPIYDFIIIALSHHFIWKSPARRLEQHYNGHVTANHLEVGAGSGYFMDRCRFPSPSPRIALMDMNSTPLRFASRRIARYRPELYQRNILEPISIDAPNFDSVGINDVLHCLPGSFDSKGIAFEHLKALMNPGAVIFGSTVLHAGVERSWAAKLVMEMYNQVRVFSNRNDNLEGLTRALGESFREVEIQVLGCSALFSARA